MNSTWRQCAAAVLTVAVLAPLGGCYKYVAIRPDQLPRLNGSFAVVTGQHRAGSTTVTTGIQTVAHVVAPDGRMVEIVGEFDVQILRRRRPEVTVEHPVVSELDQWNLVVTGSNLPRTEIPLGTIEGVEVSQFDGLASGLLGGLITLLVCGGLFPLVMLSMPD